MLDVRVSECYLYADFVKRLSECFVREKDVIVVEAFEPVLYAEGNITDKGVVIPFFTISFF